MGALENQLMECDKEILVDEIMRYRQLVRDAGAWHELALTSGRTLARVRAEITELTKSVDSLGRTPPGPAARVALLQGMVARLIAALDGKEPHDR